LESTNDLWVSSNFTRFPSVIRVSSTWAISFFKALTENGQVDHVKSSLLTILAYIPLSRVDKQDGALIALADSAASGQVGRRNLRSIRPNYDSLWFILLSLMKFDMSTVCQMRRDSDLSRLFELVIDMYVNERTRVLVRRFCHAWRRKLCRPRSSSRRSNR
jgi:hypothetical protein